jgi:tetratricopeptide (TPR) repeat protein
MRGRGLTLALVLAGVWLRPAANAQDALPALVKRLQPSVVLVQTYADSGKRLRQGSAFFVGMRGDVITNYHVISGAYRAQIKTSDGETFSVKGVVAMDATRDLVRLATDTPTESAHPLLIGRDLPEVGETVVVIGSPLGLEQTVTDGIVSAIRTLKPQGQVIQMSAPISPGSSGSPVVNLRGQVVGVASFLRDDGQNLNFAVPAGELLEMAVGKERPLASLLNPPPKTTVGEAEGYYLNGVAYLSQKNYAKALPFFEAAVRSRPSYAEAYLHIGDCLEGLGRGREALEAYRSAVLLKPDAVDFQVRLGGAFASQGRTLEAAQCYAQALQISSDDAAALMGMAQMCVRLQRNQEAIAAAQHAVRQRPDSAEAYKVLGEVLAYDGRQSMAMEAFKQAIRLMPDDPAAHCGMGDTLAKMGRDADAAAAYKEAIRLDPGLASAHLGLGLTALRAGNRGLALEEYKVLKDLDRVKAEVLFSALY